MPYRMLVYHGPLVVGVVTPIRSSARAWVAASRPTASTAARAACPKCPRIFCLSRIIMCLRLRFVGVKVCGRRRVPSRAAAALDQRLIERDREDQRGADDHHLGV